MRQISVTPGAGTGRISATGPGLARLDVAEQLVSTPAGEPGRRRWFPAAFSAVGIRFMGILSRPGIPPLLRSAYRAADNGTDPSRVSVFRTRETAAGAGRPLYPGDGGARTAAYASRSRRLPPCSGRSLSPRTCATVPGWSSHEASARVHWRSPLPAIPLACGSRTEQEPLGLNPGLHTRLDRTQPRMPGRGRASGTGPG
jgi:hypothetical protein